MAKTAAYLDTTDATLTIVSAQGHTLKTEPVPPQVLASHAGRQAAWARIIMRTSGFTPDLTVNPYPYGIEIPTV